MLFFPGPSVNPMKIHPPFWRRLSHSGIHEDHFHIRAPVIKNLRAYRRAEELGAYCYLIKGCPPSILVEALRLAGRIKASLERAPNHPSLRRFAPPAAGPSTS